MKNGKLNGKVAAVPLGRIGQTDDIARPQSFSLQTIRNGSPAKRC
jgi:hypothetical protein